MTLESVQRAIPRGAVLVEFLSYRRFNPRYKRLAERFGPQRYVAYALHPTGDPMWVDLGEAKTIDSAVVSFRKAVRDRQRSDIKHEGRVLDELVMRPLRKLLGPARQLLVSPDGELNLIPFGALVDEAGRYLIQKYSISYVTSGRDLLRARISSQSREQPMIIAAPSFDAKKDSSDRSLSPHESTAPVRSIDFSNVRFSPLPGTASEAMALGRIFPTGKLVIGDEATEETLKRVSGVRILHVATHGYFLSNQMLPRAEGRDVGLTNNAAVNSLENPLLRSGIVLAGANDRMGGGGEDGILTALEAAGLDLWGTKLVVLSACETGIGEIKNGEGVYGLRRAIVLAGAESQVMSLWQVSDQATRDLMVAYYQQLKMGQGRGEGLRTVQLKMLRTRQRRHPFYWASFIQSGAWTSIEKGKGKRIRVKPRT